LGDLRSKKLLYVDLNSDRQQMVEEREAWIEELESPLQGQQEEIAEQVGPLPACKIQLPKPIPVPIPTPSLKIHV
jgi:hypothetical protein